MMKKVTRRWRFGLLAAAIGALLAAGLPGATAEPVRVAEFLADCTPSHRLPDDPIVLPGLAGASHSHDFFGNNSTNANSTYQSLLGQTGTCKPDIDISSYWVPTLYNGQQAINPSIVTFYYLGEGVNRPQDIKATPVGLKIVAGNAKATGDADSSARWSCLHAGHVPPSKNFVECPSGTQLETYLDFPQCWNGRDLDSADHKSHMAFPVAGNCPSSHPVPTPKLRMVIRYPVAGNPAAFRLASGPGYTMHGDFFNVWPAAEMQRRVSNCINVVMKCDINGNHG